MATTFLTLVIGWYLIVMGLLILVRPEQLKSTLLEITGDPGLFFIIALLTFLLGLLMVLSHNIWIVGWPLVITLFSWLVLISGIIRLFFPGLAPTMNRYFLSHPFKMTVAGVLSILIGLYFISRIYFFGY